MQLKMHRNPPEGSLNCGFDCFISRLPNIPTLTSDTIAGGAAAESLDKIRGQERLEVNPVNPQSAQLPDHKNQQRRKTSDIKEEPFSSQAWNFYCIRIFMGVY